MDVELYQLYLLNIVLTFVMVIILVHRARIESKAVKASLEEREYKHKQRELHRLIHSEKTEILKMKKKELEEFLEHLLDLLED